MWVLAVIGCGVLVLGWAVSHAGARPRHDPLRARREIASLRCALESALRDATCWFEMDLPRPAWDAISDAFVVLEALETRIGRDEWIALQTALLAAIPRALDAQPRPAPRKLRRRRRSRSTYSP